MFHVSRFNVAPSTTQWWIAEGDRLSRAAPRGLGGVCVRKGFAVPGMLEGYTEVDYCAGETPALRLKLTTDN